MNLELMTEVHKANFLLLKEFARVCEDNKVDFFLAYGTLLGSVRHNDFIPWDDDVDIMIYAKDYDKVIQILKKDLSEEYEVVEYNKINGFFDYISRVAIQNSQCHTPTKEDIYYCNKQNKLSLDIFILCFVPNNIFLRNLFLGFRNLLYLLAMGHRYKLDYRKYLFLQSLIIWTISMIGRCIPVKCIYYFYNMLVSWGSRPSNQYTILNPPAKYFHHKCLSTKLFQNATCLFLHNELFKVPSGYVEILHNQYDNYNEEPAEEFQKPEHIIESEYYVHFKNDK